MTVDELHAKMMEGMSAEEREGFGVGLEVLGFANPAAPRVALREAFKREHPEWTEAQLDTAVRGY